MQDYWERISRFQAEGSLTALNQALLNKGSSLPARLPRLRDRGQVHAHVRRRRSCCPSASRRPPGTWPRWARSPTRSRRSPRWAAARAAPWRTTTRSTGWTCPHRRLQPHPLQARGRRRCCGPPWSARPPRELLGVRLSGAHHRDRERDRARPEHRRLHGRRARDHQRVPDGRGSHLLGRPGVQRDHRRRAGEHQPGAAGHTTPDPRPHRAPLPRRPGAPATTAATDRIRAAAHPRRASRAGASARSAPAPASRRGAARASATGSASGPPCGFACSGATARGAGSRVRGYRRRPRRERRELLPLQRPLAAQAARPGASTACGSRRRTLGEPEPRARRPASLRIVRR